METKKMDIDYMSHTRMSYFQEKGFNQNRLHELQLGPVALYEHMFYFQEVFPGKPISVSLQLKGVSEDLPECKPAPYHIRKSASYFDYGLQHKFAVKWLFELIKLYES